MEFSIVPAEGLWWLYGVFAAACAAMVFGFGRLQRQARAGSTSLALKARYALPLGAVAMIVAGWTVHEQASATIEVGQGRLQIHAGFYSQDLQISDFRLRDAELVDLRESRHLQPTSRTNGTGAPGLRAGWFVLRNRERAFLLVTDPGAVVYVPGLLGARELAGPRGIPRGSWLELKRFPRVSREVWRPRGGAAPGPS